MAGMGILLKIIDSTDVDTLSADIKKKISTHLLSENELIDEWKGKYEKLRVNTEQQFFEIEKRLIDSQTDLQVEVEKHTASREKLNKLEVSFTAVETRLKNTEKSNEDSLSLKLRLTEGNNRLESEKRELAVLVDKKNAELQTLIEESKALTERLNSSNKAKCEALSKLDEIQSQDASTKYRAKRLEQERDHLQRQCEWFNGELQQKATELKNARKGTASQLLEVNSLLEEKTQESQLLQETVESLKQLGNNQTAKIDTYISKIKQAQEESIQAEEQFHIELRSQNKLAELYRTSAEEAEAKVTELTGAAEELQKLLKEAADACAGLEEEKNNLAYGYMKQLEEKGDAIAALESELTNANELIHTLKTGTLDDEGVASLSPAAAATSKLLKSGMSLTQIYNEYVQATDALCSARDDNKRLNTYLDEIMQEIEEKAPILKRQREDYETCLRTIAQLTNQLDLSLVETNGLRRDGDDAKRRLAHFQKEGDKLKQQNTDLSQQVQYLVKEIEEVKGGRVVHEDTVSSNDVSSSSNLISEKLVTFRDISDLQVQNQRLLEVVRELTEKREEEEILAKDSKSRELTEQLEIAKQELEDLRSARSRQEQMVEAIVRQRDMYRVLLAQSGTTPLPLPPAQTSTPMTHHSAARQLSSPGLNKSGEEAKTALEELKAEYDTYRKEKNVNEKLLNDSLEKLRKDVSDLRVKNTKLASQLDFAVERHKVLQNNAEGYRKEIASIRDKNQKYSATVMKYEQNVITLREDLLAIQEKATRLEVQCQNLRVERDLLKKSEERLIQERENSHREQRSQTLLLTNLQMIQNNLERAEFETKTRLGQQIEQLDKTCNALRRKLDLEQEQHKTATRHWEGQLKELRIQLDLEMRNHQNSREEMIEARANVNTMKIEVSVAEAKMNAAESHLSKLAEIESSQQSVNVANDEDQQEEIRDLRAKMSESTAEIQALRSQVDRVKQHAEQYRTIADSMEDRIKEQNESTEQFKKSMETRIHDVQEEKQHVVDQMAELEKERQDLLDENIRITEESHNLNVDLRRQLASLQNELQEAIERREAAIANEQDAREDYQAQVKLASEAQDNYNRELMLHAAEIQALSALKSEMDQHNDKLSAAQKVARKADQELKESKRVWQDQERLYKEETEKLGTRCSELSEQNTVLHEQMEKLTNDVVAIQQQQSVSDIATLSTAITEDQSKSSDQLLEVIRFLRREKDIAETKLEVTQAECRRIKQRYEQMDRQIESLNKSLNEERERSQVTVQTAAQHAELMRKVENLNILTDSNRLLRDERDSLQTSVKEMEAKMKKLETDIEPLQASHRDAIAQRDSVVFEKDWLVTEMDRWKTRTNQLIEQSHKTDPEEHKKLVQEREVLRKQIQQLKEESHKQKAEVSQTNMNLQKIGKDLQNSQLEVTKLNTELTAQKTVIEQKTAEVDEKSETMIKLRKIGRKYKDQAEKVSKDLEALQAEVETDRAPLSQVAMEAATAEIREQLVATERVRDEAKEKVSSNEAEITNLQEKIENLEKELTELKTRETKLQSDNKEHERKQNQSRSILQTAKDKITSQKKQIDKLLSDTLQARQKLTDLELELDETQHNVSVMKEDYEDRLGQLQAALSEVTDAAIAATNNDSDLQEELDKMLKEKEDAVANSEQLKKQLELLKMQSVVAGVASPQAVRHASGAVTGERASPQVPEAARTANIRPMTAPSTPMRHAAPVQPVASAAAAVKATASIRPMAITPTTTAAHSSSLMPTPTATVMPTTVTLQDIHDDTASGSNVAQPSPPPTMATRPTQQVQRVAPQVETVADVIPVSSDSSLSTTISETLLVDPQPSTSDQQQSHPVTLQQGKRARVPDSPEMTESSPQSKKTKTQQERMASPSITVTDDQTRTSTLLPGSDIRSDTDLTIPPGGSVDVMDEESQMDEEMMGEDDNEDLYGDAVAPLGQTSEEQLDGEARELDQEVASESLEFIPPVAFDLSNVLNQESEPLAMTASATSIDTVSSVDTEFQEAQHDSDIIVLSEEDEGGEDYGEDLEDDDEDDDEEDEEQYDMEEQYEDDEEDDDEEGEEYIDTYYRGIPGDMDENEEIEEEEELDVADDEDEEEDGDEQGLVEHDEHVADDDDDVIVVDAGDGTTSQSEVTSASVESALQQAPAMSVTAQPVIASARPTPTLQPLHAHPIERLPSTSGRTHLAPFLFGAQGAGFEEGDDSIVPSTPTLFVPKRGDGFAEAVSSPQVPQSFVFASHSDVAAQPPELAQLASQGALGMDDTRMDLSQFDEGGSRTPVTPLPTGTAHPLGVITGVAEPVSNDVPSIQENTANSETDTTDIMEQTSSPSDAIDSTPSGTTTVQNSEEDQGISEEVPVEESAVQAEAGQAEDTAERTEDTTVSETGEEAGDAVSLSDQDDDASGRPKIQRIVWDEGSAVASSESATATPSLGSPSAPPQPVIPSPSPDPATPSLVQPQATPPVRHLAKQTQRIPAQYAGSAQYRQRGNRFGSPMPRLTHQHINPYQRGTMMQGQRRPLVQDITPLNRAQGQQFGQRSATSRGRTQRGRRSSPFPPQRF